jgi:hypothetical protein
VANVHQHDQKEKDKRMKQVNQRDAEHYIATRQDFRASALQGWEGTASKESAISGKGRLNDEEMSKLLEVVDSLDYVVFSYDTPIAWHSSEGWYVVAQKFSVTTSKHQNGVRRAISSELVGA